MNRILNWKTTVLVTTSFAVHAGGPLYLSGTDGKTPVVFGNQGKRVVLNYDQGSLGTRQKWQIDSIVNRAASVWNDVDTATVNFEQGNDLPQDVTASNFDDLLNDFRDGINPIIYDSDGSIIDALFGVGARRSILGFAASSYRVGTAELTEGRAVINGALSISDTTLTIALAHELGHFIGLDHTQLDNTQGLSFSDYPLMYPIANRNKVSAGDDDRAAITALYPSESVAQLWGELRGAFIQTDLSPVVGANIWVRDEQTLRVYSCVSDFLTQRNGYFRFLLPAGLYSVHAESIQSQFSSGSRVGPYAVSTGSESFRAPHPITPVVYSANHVGSPEFVNVSANCATHVEFVLDGSGATKNLSCGTNTAPVANELRINTNEDTTVSAFLVATDSDGDQLQYHIVTAPTKGSLAIVDATTGEVRYTPDINFFGNDQFSYIATDGTTQSQPANGIITVVPVNDVPISYSSDFSVTNQSYIDGQMHADDVDGDALRFHIATQPQFGSLQIINQTSGQFRYTPFTDFSGVDSATFLAFDAESNSLPATLRFIVTSKAEFIYDNQDANTVAQGVWRPSVASSPWQNDSIYSNSNGTFRWMVEAPSGNYEIYAWWTYHGNRSSSVPYRIKHGNRIDTIITNQHDPNLGGRWVSLGQYDLLSNGNSYVEVSSENGQASADAIKLIKVGDIGNTDGGTPIVSETATPVITPSGGHFDNAVTVTITTTTANAEIYYTLDGSIPTRNSTRYTNPITLTTNAQLQAIAWKANYAESSIVRANFSIQQATDEIIVDNRDKNTTLTGYWQTSTAPNAWQVESLYNNGSGTFRWMPAIQTGTYEVFAWWTYHLNRSTQVPYRISHAYGSDIRTVNQRDPSLGGQWVSLGTYSFNNNTGFIEVSSANGQACADAIKLVRR